MHRILSKADGYRGTAARKKTDAGTTKYSDETHLWVYKHYPNRSDNLICAVLVLEHSVVIKTVMHHFMVTE